MLTKKSKATHTNATDPKITIGIYSTDTDNIPANSTKFIYVNRVSDLANTTSEKATGRLKLVKFI